MCALFLFLRSYSNRRCTCRSKILLVHATPLHNDRYLYEEDSKLFLTEYLFDHNYEAILIGHTP